MAIGRFYDDPENKKSLDEVQFITLVTDFFDFEGVLDNRHPRKENVFADLRFGINSLKVAREFLLDLILFFLEEVSSSGDNHIVGLERIKQQNAALPIEESADFVFDVGGVGADLGG